MVVVIELFPLQSNNFENFAIPETSSTKLIGTTSEVTAAMEFDTTINPNDKLSTTMGNEERVVMADNIEGLESFFPLPGIHDSR